MLSFCFSRCGFTTGVTGRLRERHSQSVSVVCVVLVARCVSYKDPIGERRAGWLVYVAFIIILEIECCGLQLVKCLIFLDNSATLVPHSFAGPV